MNINTRAVVAYIAARHVTGQGTSSIRDTQKGEYLMITGSLGAEQVNIHDHQVRCQITGTRRDGRYELMHHGNGAQIAIEFEGPSFRGRDEASGSDFEGEVQGRSIHVFDAGENKAFDYSL